jgi:hypothetical protein
MPDDELARDQLAGDQLANVRQALAQHEHFYHVTTNDLLPSIQKLGIDPNFEHDRSRYGRRTHEPENAMRFFTLDPPGIRAGLSAADQRTLEFIEGIWRRGSLKPVLLRVKSGCLLSRRFGLDYSYGQVGEWRRGLARKPSAEDFLWCIREYGVISTYDVISPDQLELCTTDGERFLSESGSSSNRADPFAPLTTIKLANLRGRAESEKA